MKKLLAAALAIVMIFALSVSVFAEGSCDAKLYISDSVTWATVGSDTVTINADGVYTAKLSGLAIDSAALTVLYLKDSAVQDELATTSNLPADVQVLTKELKINGNVVALDEGYPVGLNEAGALDICWFNTWATSYFSNLGLGEINEVEVTFEVIGVSAPAAEPEAGEDVEPVEDTEPETTDDSEPAETGIALAVLPAALAAAAIALSKKR